MPLHAWPRKGPPALLQELFVLLPWLFVLAAAKFNFASATEQLCAASEELQPRSGYVLSLFSPAWLPAPGKRLPNEDRPALTGWERQEGQWVPVLTAREAVTQALAPLALREEEERCLQALAGS